MSWTQPWTRGYDSPWNPAWHGELRINPAHTLDFSKPVIQHFPTTAAGLAALIGGGQEPGYIWTLQQTSGTLHSVVGDGDLSDQSGAELMLGQKAVGLFDGSGFANRNAVEFGPEGQSYARMSGDDAAFDVPSSIAVLIVFRMGGSTPATVRSLLGKRDQVGPGWYIRTSTDGRFEVYVKDSDTNTRSHRISENFVDGAWHVGLVMINATTNTVNLWTDLGDSSEDMTAFVDFGLAGNSDAFGIGAQRTDHVSSLQIAYMAAWSGASAEAITGLGTFWTHGSDPTGKLTTATHGTLLSDVVADDDTLGELVAHYTGGHGHGVDQVTLGYHSALTRGANVGLGCWGSFTNLLTYSEDFDGNWAENGGAALTAAAGDAPDGFRRATRLEGSGSSNTTSPVATVTASTDYTASIFLWCDEGDEHDVIIELRDGANAQISADVISLTTKRTRYSITDQSSDTGMRIRVYNSHSTKTTLMWGAKLVEGDKPGPYARAIGATATIDPTLYELAGAIRPEAAEVRVEFLIPDALSETSQHIFDTQNNTNRRRLKVEQDGQWTLGELRDDGGVAFVFDLNNTPAISLDTEHAVTLLWEDGRQALYMDGTLVESDTASGWSFGSSDEDAEIGTADSGGEQLNGYIARLRIYDRVVTP